MIYRLGDGVAILVSSSLVKMHMRRALSRGEIMNFFVCENATLTWLYVQQQSSRQSEAARELIR
jgi:hypothetical protein